MYERVITATSQMLKEQGAEINKQSMESNISMETLKTAFEDAIAAIDAISNFKQEALPRMKQAVEQFRELAEQGEERIKMLEKASDISIS
ncbi:MAG TPA: toxic anion resistance protein [Defluviitaleaceae bacterium]|nr:toxic anion resistance protein [Defluviitaleaceae bacterium]